MADFYEDTLYSINKTPEQLRFSGFTETYADTARYG